MDNKQAAEAMPPGEFQKVPEICNCQELKCRKRVDAAIEAMREAAAWECESQMRNTERELFSDEDDRVSHICLLAGRIGAYSHAAQAIRALKVEEVLR